MPSPILKKINISDVLKRSIEFYKMSNKNINLNLNYDFKKKYLINGDSEQLNRVFINLIKNSIESIQEKKMKNAHFKGKITMDIKDDSDYIYVTIVDNGVGFENVDKTKMLTPYYTTKKQGTGLGLAIVTKMVNDHNGTISFNSIKNGAKVEVILAK